MRMVLCSHSNVYISEWLVVGWLCTTSHRHTRTRICIIPFHIIYLYTTHIFLSQSTISGQLEASSYQQLCPSTRHQCHKQAPPCSALHLIHLSFSCQPPSRWWYLLGPIFHLVWNKLMCCTVRAGPGGYHSREQNGYGAPTYTYTYVLCAIPPVCVDGRGWCSTLAEMAPAQFGWAYADDEWFGPRREKKRTRTGTWIDWIPEQVQGWEKRLPVTVARMLCYETTRKALTQLRYEQLIVEWGAHEWMLPIFINWPYRVTSGVAWWWCVSRTCVCQHVLCVGVKTSCYVFKLTFTWNGIIRI